MVGVPALLAHGSARLFNVTVLGFLERGARVARNGEESNACGIQDVG